MKNFFEKESACELVFRDLGDCYHLWTPENHEIIFTCDSDFQAGMNMLGLAALMFRDVHFLTFEIMSNHVHITASARQERLMQMFDCFKDLLQRWLKSCGRATSLNNFNAGVRRLNSLEEARNVIVYDNKNGYVVNPEHTPFSYPWGANRYYFSPDSCSLAHLQSKPVSLRERRKISHSRCADNIEGLLYFQGYALPLSFCDISSGEMLFRDASQYFSKLSRSVESSMAIAKEIGESVWYTDDELFASAKKICASEYKFDSMNALSSTQKIEMAKRLRFDFNASQKQLQRILRLDRNVLQALGIN